MSMPPPMMDEDGDTSSISSPPQSPQNHDGEETIKVAPRAGFAGFGEGVVQHPASASAPAPPSSTATTPLPDATVVKPKRVRKPKEPKPEIRDANGNVIVKEKKPRKPREPKVKAEGGATAAPRKRQKTEEKAASLASDARQSTLTGMQFYPPANAAATSLPSTHQQAHPMQHPQQQPSQPQHSSHQQHQPSTSSDTLMRNSIPPQAPMPTPRPFSSGQNYDPVRGQNYDPIRGAIDTASPRPPIMSNGAHSTHPSPHINRASASPSITSLIEPTTTNASAATYSAAQSKPQTAMFVNQPPPSASSKLNPALPSQQSLPSPTQPPPPAIASVDGAMAMDVDCDAPKQPTLKKASSKASSSAPTPKPSKPVSPPSKSLVKAGTGSGLLSSSSLFGGPTSSTDNEPKGVDIEIRISLRPEGGNAINIAQEIAKKYGRDAINPRAAAHRERLLQVAAQANRLENGSADDNMSVDLMSELDGDSNVEMGGMEDQAEAAPKLNANGEPIRKRRKKQEEYDKEDDFIDDTELAWQEQAAVAKDGFFVYSGPLIQPGQLAQVETTAPTRGKGTGRGRGRGRGAAAAAAAAGTTHAALAEKGKDSATATANGTATAGAGGSTTTTTTTTTTTRKPRGGGPGSRGGKVAGSGTTAPRKPRITKADQEKRDAEKAERERVMMVAGGTPAATSTTAMSNTSTPAKTHPASSTGVSGTKESSVGPGMVLSSQPTAYSPPAHLPSAAAAMSPSMGQQSQSQAQQQGQGQGQGIGVSQMRV